MDRISALSLPPAWKNVWISPDPLGHLQATGVDSRGGTQYRYHEVWREQRELQKFSHMVRFARALPGLRTATAKDLERPQLDRDRGTAAAVRLIDLGLFRIGGEKYADLIDPRVISRYELDGEFPTIPRVAAVLPVSAGAEVAVAELLT